MNYSCQWCQGKNGKEYWIGAQKLIPPLSNGANYEVKYREFKKGDTVQKFPWIHTSWKSVYWYKATHSDDAILQGKQKLRQQEIIPIERIT